MVLATPFSRATQALRNDYVGHWGLRRRPWPRGRREEVSPIRILVYPFSKMAFPDLFPPPAPWHGDVAASPLRKQQNGVPIRLTNLKKIWQTKDIDDYFGEHPLPMDESTFVEEIDFNSQPMSGDAIDAFFVLVSEAPRCVSIDANNILATIAEEPDRNYALGTLVTNVVRSCPSLKRLNLRNAGLGDSQAMMLKDVTESLHDLESVDVTHCGLSKAGALHDILKEIPNLKRLYMSNNLLCSTTNDIQTVGRLISHHENLEVLECGNIVFSCEGVDSNAFFDAIGVLSSNQATGQLNHLDISAWEIGTNRAFASSLKNFRGLETLILNYTGIANGETMRSILVALRSKPKLRAVWCFQGTTPIFGSRKGPSP